MIIGAQKGLSLQGSSPHFQLLLRFPLPTPWLELKDTVWQFGQQLHYRLFQGSHFMYLTVSVPFTMYKLFFKSTL